MTKKKICHGCAENLGIFKKKEADTKKWGPKFVGSRDKLYEAILKVVEEANHEITH